ncbi:MAG: hypothetical protein AB7E45_08250 [Candidatus Caldatribacteriota bacterium]
MLIRLIVLVLKGFSMFNKLFFDVLSKVLAGASPEIRNMIKNFLIDLEEKAKKTENPIDDILVMLLRIFTGF